MKKLTADDIRELEAITSSKGWQIVEAWFADRADMFKRDSDNALNSDFTSLFIERELLGAEKYTRNLPEDFRNFVNNQKEEINYER